MPPCRRLSCRAKAVLKKLKRGGGESEETYTCGKCVKNEVQSSELPGLL